MKNITCVVVLEMGKDMNRVSFSKHMINFKGPIKGCSIFFSVICIA